MNVLACENDPLYCVTIRHNLVAGIDRRTAPAGVEIPDTQLEVSTQLAANFRARGLMDGDYYFRDSEPARHFATISLQFIKQIAEKSLADLDGASVRHEGWSNPHAWNAVS